jgi:NAD(P)-dependent dehydrogenase (short-subunit alcohol dehydrogenase family)
VPTWLFDAHATYLIAGGFGGVARSIARWMASRGAKNLVLLSRSGPQSGKSTELIHDLEKLGVRVAAPACDVSSEELLRKALDDIRKEGMPPIKGCIQGSMVLRVSSITNDVRRC